MTQALYRFRKATLADRPLLDHWQVLAHVQEWWDSAPIFDAADVDDARIARWMVHLDGAPIAYLQDYAVHGWEAHHFAHLPEGARGLDQFIGPGEMLNCGHGTAFIGQRMQALFGQGCPVLASDPHPSNDRAIAVYRKLGFRPSGPARASQWGQFLPMVIWAPPP